MVSDYYRQFPIICGFPPTPFASAIPMVWGHGPLQKRFRLGFDPESVRLGSVLGPCLVRFGSALGPFWARFANAFTNAIASANANAIASGNANANANASNGTAL